MPYPKGHTYEGMFFCKECSEDCRQEFSYEVTLMEEECEAFEPRS